MSDGTEPIEPAPLFSADPLLPLDQRVATLEGGLRMLSVRLEVVGRKAHLAAGSADSAVMAIDHFARDLAGIRQELVAIVSQLTHQDECLDLTRNRVTSLLAEVLRLDKRLDTLGEILAKLATGQADALKQQLASEVRLGEIEKTVGRSAWLTPAATSGGAGAVVAGLAAIARGLGWI